jgi:hypothetical protein
MKTIFYILAICLTIVSCQKENTANSIVSEFENRILNSESWEYDVHYKMKYFSSDEDTLNYYSNISPILYSVVVFGLKMIVSTDIMI